MKVTQIILTLIPVNTKDWLETLGQTSLSYRRIPVTTKLHSVQLIRAHGLRLFQFIIVSGWYYGTAEVVWVTLNVHLHTFKCLLSKLYLGITLVSNFLFSFSFPFFPPFSPQDGRGKLFLENYNVILSVLAEVLDSFNLNIKNTGNFQHRKEMTKGG